MTLIERYQQAKNQPRQLPPALAFISEVAAVTKKSEPSIRRWLAGECEPDDLTKAVLAKHFNTTPEKLFPAKK